MRPESWPEALTPYHLTVGQARYRTDRRQGGKSQGNAPTVLALQEPEKRVGDPAGRSQASLLLQAMENQCVSLVFYHFEWHSAVDSGDAKVVCENQLSYRQTRPPTQCT